MPMLYLSFGTLLGIFLTLLVIRPKRCKECAEREWLKTFGYEFRPVKRGTPGVENERNEPREPE